MPYAPLTQFETRRAELEAQLTRLAELRARLHEVEAARCSPSEDGGLRRRPAPAPLRPSETT